MEKITIAMKKKLNSTTADKIIDSFKDAPMNEPCEVENHLIQLTTGEELTGALPQKISRLMGSITLPDDFDYKRDLAETLMEKYK